MDLRLTPEQDAFLESARAWLAAHTPAGGHAPPGSAEDVAASRAWDRALFDAGWSVLTWPKRYGGRDATPMEWILFEQAYHEAHAPYRLSANGISLLAPTVLEFGTEAQKEEILRPMARGDVLWAQAWSEPEAGSDLAALKSRATPVPGGFRLDGRKTWSSHSASADMAFGLFRTGGQSGRHRALTYILLPLDAPGIAIEPIRRLDRLASFSEITFTNVFVPESAVLGEVGRGWSVAMATTGSERGFSLRSPGRFTAAADRLERLLTPEIVDAFPDLADRVLDVRLDAEAYRLHVLQSVSKIALGTFGPGDASLEKLHWSELEVRLNVLALELLALQPDADADTRIWLESFVAALPGTIWGGTSEIQRNIVAQRVLDLPRSY
ncbi:MAG TPA: acyl-CoA dehydrogenase family protein [Pseudolysinimonas sp.]|nr:acyl-CoA dehydrogenase family protein [Pseudolysinimonas sp.]